MSFAKQSLEESAPKFPLFIFFLPLNDTEFVHLDLLVTNIQLPLHFEKQGQGLKEKCEFQLCKKVIQLYYQIP